MANDNERTLDHAAIARRGYLPVFAGAACISFAGFFVKGSALDPSAIVFYRLFFGAAALFAVALARRMRLRPERAVLARMAMASFFFSVDLIFWHKSIVLVGPGIGTILTNFQVIFLALHGVVFLGEKMSWPQRLSIPIALLGLALLLGLHESALPPGIIMGTVYGLLSATFYAGYVLSIRRTQTMPGKLPPVANIAWVSAMGAAMVAAYCAAGGISLAIPDAKTLAGVATLGICCQSLGWLLLSMGLPYLAPFRAGLIMLTQPALAFVWDMLVYGSVTGFVNIFGAVLAIAAIGMGIYEPPGRKKS